MGRKEDEQEILDILEVVSEVPDGKVLVDVFNRMTREDLITVHPDWTDSHNKGLVAQAFIKDLGIFDPTLLTLALVTDHWTTRLRLWFSSEVDNFLYIPLEEVWSLDLQAVPGTLVMAVAAIFDDQGQLINYSGEDVPFHHNILTIGNLSRSRLPSESPLSKIPSYFEYHIREGMGGKGVRFPRQSLFIRRAGYGVRLGS
ncbi:MAG: hypothetical protein Q7S44_03080 [bacterium]|nr:hypothetical protein [bacterium]